MDTHDRDRVQGLFSGLLEPLALPPEELERFATQMRRIRDEFSKLRLYYQFGIDEVLTKVTILRQEFEASHDHSPIEHVRSRLKSTDSLLAKIVRVGCEPDLASVRAQIRDIAGIRITSSFVSDAYWIASMLERQPDVTVLQTKDYIAAPKDNGYRSLHLIVEIPVYLSEHTERIPVEIQIRTIAMDFWASVEHKLSYKYGGDVPADITEELDAAAQTAAELDERMEHLRAQLGDAPPADQERD